MKRTKIFFPIFFALLAGLAIGCKKYEDGPGLSLKSKENRLTQTWNIEAYFVDGTEATVQLRISAFSEEFMDNGTYLRAYVDKDGDPFSESGSWKWDTDKMQIKIDGVSSLELTDQHSTVTTSDLNILRLANKELWYAFENGGSLHEFHLVRE